MPVVNRFGEEPPNREQILALRRTGSQQPDRYNPRKQREFSAGRPNGERVAAGGWLGREDSNLRMTVPKTVALPLGDAPSDPVLLGRGRDHKADGVGPPVRPRAGGPWRAGRRRRARRSAPASRSSGIMFGPSEGARSGSGWVSMNTAATPSATAARAITGANSRWPPEEAALPARLLHRVGRVHHHRIAGPRHDRQAAHVGDQRVVAEGGAALAEQDALVAGRGDLRRDVAPCPRARGTGPS